MHFHAENKQYRGIKRPHLDLSVYKRLVENYAQAKSMADAGERERNLAKELERKILKREETQIHIKEDLEKIWENLALQRQVRDQVLISRPTHEAVK